jgi:hypothetical protein
VVQLVRARARTVSGDGGQVKQLQSILHCVT